VEDDYSPIGSKGLFDVDEFSVLIGEDNCGNNFANVRAGMKVFFGLPACGSGEFLRTVEAELVVVLIFGLRHSVFLTLWELSDCGPVSAVTVTLGQRLWE
tara:strand:- start:36 stop:335 length:300 start_codon:yes stop_codon:yes gene_type:complete